MTLKALEEKQPNPAENRMVDPKLIQEDPEYGNMWHDNLESQFIKDKRIQERLDNKQRNKQRAGLDIEQDRIYRKIE